MKRILFLLVMSFILVGCEQDDVCASTTPTTPKVVLEFYDNANPTELKNVVNLGVFNTTYTVGYTFTNVNKGKISLKTFQDSSAFYFIQNGTDSDTTNDNLDEITFNYTRRNEYVSRACGYKTLFTLDTTNPIVLTPDGNNWIQNIVVSQSNIENENETHVKIYF